MTTRRLVLIALMTLIVAFGSVAVWGLTTRETGKSAEELEREVADAVPVGSTEGEITAYLAEQRLDYTTFRARPADELVREHGVAVDSVVISATVEQPPPGWLISFASRDLIVNFVLDAERRLGRVVVTERVTSL